MAMSESSLFNLPAIFYFLPNCKIIHVIRRGVDVAYNIEEKRHFSDQQLMRPPHARIYYPTVYKGKNFYIPCWVAPKDKIKFLEYSEFERSLFHWCSLMEKTIE